MRLLLMTNCFYTKPISLKWYIIIINWDIDSTRNRNNYNIMKE